MARDTYPPVADVAQLQFHLTPGADFAGIEVQYDLYWRDDAATRNFAYLQGLADDAVAAWADATGVANVTDDDWTLAEVRAVDLDTVTHLSADSTTSAPGLLVAGPQLPLSVCAIVGWPNTEGGPPRSPYIRYAPLRESSVTGNKIGPTARQDLIDAWAQTISVLEASQPNGELVVVSVYEPKATPGYDPAEPYRDAGLVKIAATTPTVRQLVGRCASRLT